jgi:hypothetical protein
MLGLEMKTLIESKAYLDLLVDFPVLTLCKNIPGNIQGNRGRKGEFVLVVFS